MQRLACMIAVTAVAACTTAPSRRMASIGDAPDCVGWAALTLNERFAVIGSALEQKVGRPAESKLAACLWSISDRCSRRGRWRRTVDGTSPVRPARLIAGVGRGPVDLQFLAERKQGT